MKNKLMCIRFNSGREYDLLGKRRNLKLTILDPDSTQEGGLLTIRKDGLASATYRASLQPCHSPTCPCCNILFACKPIPADGSGIAAARSPKFWLDVFERAVVITTELENDPESLQLANDICAALVPDDWECLYEWFRLSKLNALHVNSLEEVDTQYLPDADDGLLTPFVEVFPWGLALYFQLKDEIWAVDDHYCVQPNCQCKVALLNFLKLVDASGKKTTSLKDSPAIRYDHSSGTTLETFRGAPGHPDPAVLLAALKCTHPMMHLMLEFRHLMMQKLYLLRAAEKLRSKINSLQVSTGVRRAPKVGRNEPCPCGSGKKYKHCCLLKKPVT